MSQVQQLTVTFDSEADFLREYEGNIAKSGIFVETDAPCELRESVTVMLDLASCAKMVSLAAEVVHVVPVELAQTGATPGVALQLLACAEEPRARFDGLTKKVEPDSDLELDLCRRESSRSTARVAAKVKAGGTETYFAHTRDISQTGALISAGAEPVPVGEKAQLSLKRPLSGEELPVEGAVVRHIVSDEGAVAALGIEFDDDDLSDNEFAGFVDRVAATEHSRKLGTISGPISEFGVAMTLQMFGCTAPQGTLILRNGQTEGFVAVVQGYLVAASSGKRNGVPALAELISWRTGDFEFETNVVSNLGEHEPIALDEALAMAKEIVDVAAKRKTPGGAVSKNTNMKVHATANERTLGNLNKLEEALLELAVAGMTVGKAMAIIPEPEQAIIEAVQSLQEQQLVVLS